VGAVERGHVLPKLADVQAGDVLIGVASSGLHSNGYSLVRHIVSGAGLVYADPAPFAKTMTLAEALLAPTRLYVRSALSAIRAGGIKALAHITGGGITENLPRVLPEGLDAGVDLAAWTPPAVFSWLAQSAGVAESEMLRTFNCGIGLIAVVAADDAHIVTDAFRRAGETVFTIGQVVAGDGEPKVHYHGALRLT
jgi:phosphoribosylformylglycinamidine cyclo-ligase